jgi:hypothetical protein
MAESLEEYLQRLLQQAMEKKAPPRRPAPPPVLEAEVVELEEIPEAPHAGQGLVEILPTDAQPMAPRISELGRDRPLGDLRATSAEADSAAPATAEDVLSGVIDLLRSPDGIRKAFLLSEILHRPEDRW